MVFMRVLSFVCVLRDFGLIRLQLLSVCYWRVHVMSIMGSPSWYVPEHVASVLFFFCILCT